jgi:hypothetical protein
MSNAAALLSLLLLPLALLWALSGLAALLR